MAEHELKTWPVHFQAVKAGEKRFEIRRNDRRFAVGDALRLREWSPSAELYTGDEVTVEVLHILPGGAFDLGSDSVAMSIVLRSAVSAERPGLQFDLARILAAHFASRPWEEMAEHRAHLRTRCRENASYDVNEATIDDCMSAATDVIDAMLSAVPATPEGPKERGSSQGIGHQPCADAGPCPRSPELSGFMGDWNTEHLTALGAFTRSTYEQAGRNADPVELFEAGMFWALKHLAAADRKRAEKAEVDLNVIHRAAAHCQGKFGGRMSEVDRIFQEITRVSAMHKTRAALGGRTPVGGEAVHTGQLRAEPSSSEGEERDA